MIVTPPRDRCQGEFRGSPDPVVSRRGRSCAFIGGVSESNESVRAGLSESEMRENFMTLVFQGDPVRYETFTAVLTEALPADVAAVIRGSSVTGRRWEDGAPFDADGTGTSDIDLTLVGSAVIEWFLPHGFYIADIHSKPLCEKDPDIAPLLVPLREKLTAIAGRPVNIQATRNWVMFFREYLMGQPYLTLIGKVDTP